MKLPFNHWEYNNALGQMKQLKKLLNADIPDMSVNIILIMMEQEQ